MKRHHHFQAAGLNLQQVELLDRLADGPAADLFDNSDPVIGVNDLVAYVEIAIRTQHAEPPTAAGDQRNNTDSVYRNGSLKAILDSFSTGGQARCRRLLSTGHMTLSLSPSADYAASNARVHRGLTTI